MAVGKKAVNAVVVLEYLFFSVLMPLPAPYIEIFDIYSEKVVCHFVTPLDMCVTLLYTLLSILIRRFFYYVKK